METQEFNTKEQIVLNMLIENAKEYNEGGACCWEETPYMKLGISTRQM